MEPAGGPGTPGRDTAGRPSVSIVDLGAAEDDGGASRPAESTGAADPAPTPPRRRRTAYVAAGVAALLVVVANLLPRGDAPPPLGKAADVQDRPLSVCEAVAFAEQTGGLPSKPTVLPGRATGYFAVTDRPGDTTVVVGLTYEDGTVSLCRPVREPGTGSPKPRQRELPILGRGNTYAYEARPSGLVLVGERSAAGTVIRFGTDGGSSGWEVPGPDGAQHERLRKIQAHQGTALEVQ